MNTQHFDTGRDQRHTMIQQLVDYFRRNNITVKAAVGIENLPLPQLFPNPGYGDQKRKQPHVLGIHNETGDVYIGLVKTRDQDLTDDSSLTEYDVYIDIASRRDGIHIYLMIDEDRIHQFNSFITHYIHPDYWTSLTIVAYSDDA